MQVGQTGIHERPASYTVLRSQKTSGKKKNTGWTGIREDESLLQRPGEDGKSEVSGYSGGQCDHAKVPYMD